jgi:hypothetical protein
MPTMTKRLLLPLVIAAAVLNVAPSARAKSNKDRTCLSVVAGSLQKPWSGGKDAGEKKFGRTEAAVFSATEVLDVEFAIVFSKTVAAQFSDVHMVEFRIYTPQGHLYESITIPMTADSRRAGERHRVPGYPDLVPVQVLQSIKRGGGQGMFVEVTLPVAGTSIVSNSLYGEWKAEAVVEDETAPCAQTMTFTIAQ